MTERYSQDAAAALKDASNLIYLRDIGRVDDVQKYIKGLEETRGTETVMYTNRLVDVLDTLNTIGALKGSPSDIWFSIELEEELRHEQN